MLSALIHSVHSYPAMPLAGQLVHQRYVHPGPLVLRTGLLKFPTPADGPSTQNHRITKSDFHPCSTCMSCNQALFCLYTLRTISDRTERTFERLRYLFGRRPPQSNCPPDSVPRPDSWPMVRVPVLQGWYPKDGSAKTGVLVSKPPTYPVHVVPRPNVKLQ